MYYQSSMPLVKAVENYLQKKYLRMHMPGHKGECAQILAALLDKPFQADFTELPGLDDLHAPQGVIAEAEKLAADLFGAESAIFIVNGATQGIISLMMLDKGQKVILPRHAHKSLYNGLILSGAQPVYIKSKLSPEWGVSVGIDFEYYCNVAANNLDAAQVWVTSPTYFGHIEDITRIKKFLPDKAKLFVDEAHGAHLRFLGLPDAIAQGADAAVQSWHKTLGSLTQSAVILFSNTDLAAKVRKTISLTESTSPSYLLLLSLDAARYNIAKNGRAILEETKHNVTQLIAELKELGYIKIMPTDDITKLSISVNGMSGYELFNYLSGNGIMPEMAQNEFVLLQAVLHFTKSDGERILSAIKKLPVLHKNTSFINLLHPPVPKAAMLPREAFYSNDVSVDLDQAIGRISTEFIIPYPPGIPLIVPGEIVDAETIEYIKAMKSLGANFQGTQDIRLNKLKVVKE